MVAKGEGKGVGLADAKYVLLTERMGNEVLLYSTGNCIQRPGINHNEKNTEKNARCLYLSHFGVQKKLTSY